MGLKVDGATCGKSCVGVNASVAGVADGHGSDLVAFGPRKSSLCFARRRMSSRSEIVKPSA